MKRNIDRMREIMMEIEAASVNDELEYHSDEDCYQLSLLKDGGFVECDIYENDAEGSAYPIRLTMKGHDFLDNIRDASVWKKVKLKLSDALGSVSLAVVSGVAETYIKTRIGLP